VEIKILKLFRAHGRLLGHAFRRPAQPAPACVADTSLGHGIQSLHGCGHVLLGNGGKFKRVSASANFYIGVHVLHFRHAVAGDGFILFLHGSGKHLPVQARLVQAQKGEGACSAHFPDEGHSHFFRNIRQFQKNPVTRPQGGGIPRKLGRQFLKTSVSHAFIR